MDNETGRKIALAGALMAGIAYFGLSILRDIFTDNHANSVTKNTDNNNHSKNRKRHVSDGTDIQTASVGYEPLSHTSSQTDLTLPVGLRQRSAAFGDIPPELWSPWAKSIQERIRELNMRLVNTTNFQFKHSMSNRNHYLMPNNTKTSISCGNTPKRHLSGSQSPEPLAMNGSRERLYRSVECLDANHVETNGLMSGNSCVGLKRAIDMALPSETEILIHKRILDKLFGKSTPNLSQQDAKSLTVLLMSRDEDLMIKTLSVIANCCAFSVNIDTICDSGCILLLYELLFHKDRAVQTAATNAIANIANGERAQELLKECIPVLVNWVKTSDNDLLTNWTLRALANLALRDSNQILMTAAIDKLMALLMHPNPAIRLQSIKLLVNLSTNSQLVPYLLAAKAPINLYALLDSSHDTELVLRLTNFLANVIDTTCLREITPRDLPVEYKASSPETLYSAIYGFESTELLLKKLNALQSIPHEDVVFQVNRILKKVR